MDFDAGYRREIRVADFNGDQQVDIAWVHPIDGSTVVWINTDYRKGRAGWHRLVTYPKDVALGFGFSGANVAFARINIAHGRADYVAISPSSGAAYVWKNSCDNIVPAGGDGAGGNGTGESDVPTPNSCNVPDGTSSSGNNNGGSSGTGSGGNPDNPDTPLIPFITIGDSTFTENSATQVVVDGQTLAPGGQITVGGATISLDGDGGNAVVNGATQTAGHAAPTDVPITGVGPTLVFGGTCVSSRITLFATLDWRTSIALIFQTIQARHTLPAPHLNSSSTDRH